MGQGNQCAHSNTRCSGGGQGSRAGSECRRSDVEVHPRHILDELVEEGCGEHGAPIWRRVALTQISHTRTPNGLRGATGDGHGPHGLTRRSRDLGEILQKLGSIREDPGHPQAQRDRARSRERCHVDDEIRVQVARQGQCVGQDKSPLFVRIADLNGLAIAELDDVAGSSRGATGGGSPPRARRPSPESGPRVWR